MYEININICAKLSFFGLSARTSKKSFKNDLREPPRPLPPGGKIDQERSQDAPKELQDGPKSPPYNFPPPPFPPGAPSWGRPGAHDAPGGLQKPVWDPRGAKFGPRASEICPPEPPFLAPRASLSSPSCEPLSHAGGTILCLLCSRHLARRNARSG